MFKFLKDKLKKAVKAFSSKVEKEGEKHVIESTRIEVNEVEAPTEMPKEEEQKEELEEQREEVEEQEPEEKKEEVQKEEEHKSEVIIEESGEPEEKPEEEKPKEEGPQIIIEGDEVPEEVPQQTEVLEDIRREDLIKEIEDEEKPKLIIEEEGGVEEEIFGEEPEEKKMPELEAEEEPSETLEKVEPPQEEQDESHKEEHAEPLEEEPAEPKQEEKEDVKPAAEKKGFFTKLKEKITHKEEKGMFKRIKEKIVTTTISGKKFEKIFWDLELAMLENNVALGVVEKIKEDLRETIVDNPIKRDEIGKIIGQALRKSVEEVLSVKPIDLLELSKSKKPYVICFVGVNGSGKTTTIAKVAKWFQNHHMVPVIAAGDTFRAAAIQQIEEHSINLKVRVIKHDYGSDAAAVAFDAIKHAESKDKDVVLIDTAGRLHSNRDLIDELKKVIRVSKPDLVLFVGESITGNDCVEQAKEFNEHIGVDGIILAKADVDEKGGAALSVSYVTKKPIVFLGTGQGYDDLEVFEKGKIMSSLGL